MGITRLCAHLLAYNNYQLMYSYSHFMFRYIKKKEDNYTAILYLLFSKTLSLHMSQFAQVYHNLI